MKRVMIFFVVVLVLLFSQLALAEAEFELVEPTMLWVENLQDQGLPNEELAATELKVVPMQAFTHLEGDFTVPRFWWAPDNVFGMSVWFRVYGSGSGTVKITITDTKTGQIVKKIKSGPRDFYEALIGLGFSSSIPAPASLPRKFNIKFSIAVGTIVKSISTNIMLE